MVISSSHQHNGHTHNGLYDIPPPSVQSTVSSYEESFCPANYGCIPDGVPYVAQSPTSEYFPHQMSQSASNLGSHHHDHHASGIPSVIQHTYQLQNSPQGAELLPLQAVAGKVKLQSLFGSVYNKRNELFYAVKDTWVKKNIVGRVNEANEVS